MKFLVLGPMKDLQTGLYIVQSIEELGHQCEFIDIRALTTEHGLHEGQKVILDLITEVKYSPDIVIVLKGVELSFNSLNTIKDAFPKAKLVNWFFDVKLSGTDIWDNHEYHPSLKLYDYFFCSLGGVAKTLRDYGFNNAYHVGEGCYPPLHGEQYMNNYQKKLYGEDVTFIGTIGLQFAHRNRIQFLSKLIKEGVNVKIWGMLIGEAKSIPLEIRHNMTGEGAINEKHSMVCQSSLINLGIDQDPSIEYSWSARLYRIMCAGALYLSTPTVGLKDYFKVNEEGEEITEDQELVVFYDENDLIKKIDFLLEHDDIREKIAKNGQNKVVAKHKFVDRVKELIEVVENGKN